MNIFSKASTVGSNSSTPVQDGASGGTQLTYLHQDIIEAHILTRLDGPTLAASSCSSTTLRHLSSQDHLWSHLCRKTWPSTSDPRVSGLVSSFPNGGPRAFLAHCFPLPSLEPAHQSRSPPQGELISAVDMRYKNELIISKVKEAETGTRWFRCAPLRIDMIEPDVAVSTPLKHLGREDTWSALIEDVELSWIMLDPIGRRAANLSSNKPVSVQRHWLSGEIQAKYSSILDGGHVLCEIVVTWGRSGEGGEIQVKEVSMEMEDMDGVHLNGKDSLVILQGAMEGKRGKAREREEKRRYDLFVERRRVRRERKMRKEGALDAICVVFGSCFLVAFWGSVWGFF